MVGPQGRLADLQGALQLGAGAGQVPQVLQHEAEVAVPGTDVGVVGAQGRLADLQGPLQLGAGAGQVPQAEQDEAERVAAGANLDVVGAEGGLGESDPACGERSSLPVPGRVRAGR